MPIANTIKGSTSGGAKRFPLFFFIIWSIAMSLRCPTCNNPEEHPTLKNKIIIDGYKVHDGKGWLSHCLFCAGYYNLDLTERPLAEGSRYPVEYDGRKGWFY